MSNVKDERPHPNFFNSSSVAPPQDSLFLLGRPHPQPPLFLIKLSFLPSSLSSPKPMSFCAHPVVLPGAQDNHGGKKMPLREFKEKSLSKNSYPFKKTEES